MLCRYLFISVIVALILPFLGGCGHIGRETKTETEDTLKIPVTSDLTSAAVIYADSLLATMSLEERVGQCFMPAIYARTDSATIRRLRDYIEDMHVGGVVLLKGNLESAARLAGIGGGWRIPLFMAIDAEWGLGMRLADAPDFPRNGNISSKADEQLLFEYGAEVARECRRTGINMVLGPVIDVVENPGGVIGSRSFGGDRERVGALGVAYAKGLESGRVISVAKHFPGHGSPAGDSHREIQVISRSLHALDSVDLYPFRRYVESGLSGVMVGHLAVPAIDPEMLPAAVSPVVITDLLRGELGFTGLVLTDALNMGGAEGYGGDEAVMAGADIVIAPRDTKREIKRLLKLAEENPEVRDAIDERCRRILFYKYLVSEEAGEISLQGLQEDVAGGADSLSRLLTE